MGDVVKTFAVQVASVTGIFVGVYAGMKVISWLVRESDSK